MVESKRRLPRIITVSLGTSGPLRSILSRRPCPHDTRKGVGPPGLALSLRAAGSVPGLPHRNIQLRRRTACTAQNIACKYSRMYQGLFEEAVSWHGQGRLAEAEQLYRRVLAAN